MSSRLRCTRVSQRRNIVRICRARRNDWWRMAPPRAIKGEQVHQVVKVIGSAVNESRPEFLTLLVDPASTVIMVEHKDRATRFGFRYLDTLLELQGRRSEVVNWADNGREDLLADLVAIRSSCCARLCGQRRAERKSETIVKELTGQEASATGEAVEHAAG